MFAPIFKALGSGFTSYQILNYLTKKFPKYANYIQNAHLAGYAGNTILQSLNSNDKSGNADAYLTENEWLKRDNQRKRRKERVALGTGIAGAAALAGGAGYLLAGRGAVNPTQILMPGGLARGGGGAAGQTINVTPTPPIRPNIGGGAARQLTQQPGQLGRPWNRHSTPPLNPQSPLQLPNKQRRLTQQAPQAAPAAVAVPPTPRMPQRPPLNTPPVITPQFQHDPQKNVNLIKNINEEKRISQVVSSGLEHAAMTQVLREILPKSKIAILERAPGGFDQAILDFSEFKKNELQKTQSGSKRQSLMDKVNERKSLAQQERERFQQQYPATEAPLPPLIQSQEIPSEEIGMEDEIIPQTQFQPTLPIPENNVQISQNKEKLPFINPQPQERHLKESEEYLDWLVENYEKGNYSPYQKKQVEDEIKETEDILKKYKPDSKSLNRKSRQSSVKPSGQQEKRLLSAAFRENQAQLISEAKSLETRNFSIPHYKYAGEDDEDFNNRSVLFDAIKKGAKAIIEGKTFLDFPNAFTKGSSTAQDVLRFMAGIPNIYSPLLDDEEKDELSNALIESGQLSTPGLKPAPGERDIYGAQITPNLVWNLLLAVEPRLSTMERPPSVKGYKTNKKGGMGTTELRRFLTHAVYGVLSGKTISTELSDKIARISVASSSVNAIANAAKLGKIDKIHEEMNRIWKNDKELADLMDFELDDFILSDEGKQKKAEKEAFNKKADSAFQAAETRKRNKAEGTKSEPKKDKIQLLDDELSKAYDKLMKLDEEITQENRSGKKINVDIRSEKIKRLKAAQQRVDDLRNEIQREEILKYEKRTGKAFPTDLTKA